MVNVIQGERLPDSMLNVRTPIVRIPMWAAITWWTTKGLARLVRWYLRHWYATLPATALLWAYLRFGWLDLVVAAGSVIVWRVCGGGCTGRRSCGWPGIRSRRAGGGWCTAGPGTRRWPPPDSPCRGTANASCPN